MNGMTKATTQAHEFYVGDCKACHAKVVDCCEQCERCVECCICYGEVHPRSQRDPDAPIHRAGEPAEHDLNNTKCYCPECSDEQSKADAQADASDTPATVEATAERCPWCGVEATEKDEWGWLIPHRPKCYWTNIHGDPIGRVRVNFSEVEQWNTRSADAEVKQLREALREVIQEWADPHEYVRSIGLECAKDNSGFPCDQCVLGDKIRALLDPTKGT